MRAEQTDLPEGTPLLANLSKDEAESWQQVSGAAADRVWDDSDDDICAELLRTKAIVGPPPFHRVP